MGKITKNELHDNLKNEIETKANQTDLDTISLNLNNTIDKHLADYSTDEGIANTYKITLTPAPTSYEIGKVYKFKAINANTGASTFQIGTLTATSIKKNVTTDLASGDIVAGQIVTVVFDGTNFQLIGITQAERTTWNGKQNALGFTPLNKNGDTATGIVVAQSNTSYTTRQVHNIILSTADANVGSMQNGDIWCKYK